MLAFHPRVVILVRTFPRACDTFGLRDVTGEREVFSRMTCEENLLLSSRSY